MNWTKCKMRNLVNKKKFGRQRVEKNVEIGLTEDD